MLKIEKLSMRFGGLTAVNALDAEVEPQKIVSVIGPNGAGKTTVFNMVTGIYEPSEGDFFLEGDNLVEKCKTKTVLFFLLVGFFVGVFFLFLRPRPPDYITPNGRTEQYTLLIEPLWKIAISDPFSPSKPQSFSFISGFLSAFKYISKDGFVNGIFFLIGTIIGSLGAFTVWRNRRRTTTRIVRHGISRTFQNIRLFKEMSVLENVLISMDRYQKSYLLLTALAIWKLKEDTQEQLEAMNELNFVGLGHRAYARAASLPYGEQRRLEIARALATKPKLLLLDEPAAGMNPVESAQLMELIKKIRDRGITVLLIEHHMKVVMGLSDHIIVLDHGTKISEGDPVKVSKDKLVLEAYLGKEEIE